MVAISLFSESIYLKRRSLGWNRVLNIWIILHTADISKQLRDSTHVSCSADWGLTLNRPDVLDTIVADCCWIIKSIRWLWLHHWSFLYNSLPWSNIARPCIERSNHMVEPKNIPWMDYIPGSLPLRTWIRNYIHVKQWDVIIYSCPNFNGGLVKPPLNE